MVLRAADSESRPDKHIVRRLRFGMAGDDFRAERVRSDKAVRPMLLHGSDGNQDGAGFSQPGFDVLPGGNGEQHGVSPSGGRGGA